MKRKILTLALVLVAASTLVPTPAYAYRRLVIDRNNYNTQQDRIDGCWLAVARNFVVAQQPNRSAQSDTTVSNQYDTVCRAVKGTTADVSGGSQDACDAMELFDEMLGNGAHAGDYTHASGKKDFSFVFDQIAEYANPVAITLGGVEGSTVRMAHDVLINGADDGTNLQEVVRVLNNDNVVWAQYYDLAHGTVGGNIGNRQWIATMWCE